MLKVSRTEILGTRTKDFKYMKRNETVKIPQACTVFGDTLGANYHPSKDFAIISIAR